LEVRANRTPGQTYWSVARVHYREGQGKLEQKSIKESWSKNDEGRGERGVDEGD